MAQTMRITVNALSGHRKIFSCITNAIFERKCTPDAVYCVVGRRASRFGGCMSETIIVTTRAILEEIVVSAVQSIKPAELPFEAVELERLKRKEYLTPDEVEKIFGLNANTLRKRRVEGTGPEYSKDGDRVLYARRVVERYLEQRRQKTYEPK